MAASEPHLLDGLSGRHEAEKQDKCRVFVRQRALRLHAPVKLLVELGVRGVAMDPSATDLRRAGACSPQCELQRPGRSGRIGRSMCSIFSAF